MHDPGLQSLRRGPVRRRAGARGRDAWTDLPCLANHAHESGPEGTLAAGLDASLVRDLLLEVAVVADHTLEIAPTVPEG